jgi:RNA recognition motif-containing protein
MSDVNELKIFVGNLPFQISNEELESLFSQCGSITGINLRKDRTTGKSKGFGFITFDNARSAVLAIENMNGCICKGRPLTVKGADKRGGGKEDEESEGKSKIIKKSWTEWSGPS